MASLFFWGNPVPLFSHEVVNARRLCYTKPKWGKSPKPQLLSETTDERKIT